MTPHRVPESRMVLYDLKRSLLKLILPYGWSEKTYFLYILILIIESTNEKDDKKTGRTAENALWKFWKLSKEWRKMLLFHSIALFLFHHLTFLVSNTHPISLVPWVYTNNEPLVQCPSLRKTISLFRCISSNFNIPSILTSFFHKPSLEYAYLKLKQVYNLN